MDKDNRDARDSEEYGQRGKSIVLESLMPYCPCPSSLEASITNHQNSNFTLIFNYHIASDISPEFLRYFAITLIAVFGLMMIFPLLGEKFAELTSGIANLGQSVQTKSKGISSGFWSGFVLGIALGLVWTPCTGPILATITTVAATSAITGSIFLITLMYSLGAAIPKTLKRLWKSSDCFIQLPSTVTLRHG